MSAVITLTTDFGDSGPFVGVMKAVILRHAPAATVIDVCHHVAPWQRGEAGFWIARCYRQFPRGSVHVAVVDPGVGTQRAILACDWDDHVFLAPDNGILTMVATPQSPVHALDDAWVARRGWPARGRTFHGRDLFAPLAAAFLTGTARPADIGPRVTPQPPAIAPARRDGARITGRVAAVDTWGNLITNIDAALIGSIHDPRVLVGDRELPLVSTYGDAPAGTLFALVNSVQTIEVACREGSAAHILGLGHGAPVTVTGATADGTP
jgi:S-adenosylmethionine hydrolase